ncbi:putative inorganic carbon (HCO3(-)) transporter [Anaerospora hongkongensis]|uniref:Putative inorganic carbon (HCO3(-)) transporter n=1 Tax=Anaerospora hongkongensis TaxID=244830 RepID=A0A4R1PW77_9FIRM|nr:O-antigen ligase family protein [Anaerospora hongkongensis]TCL36523.1 putative inorganic carbon (HCO3(-)) transporter [Anaerospora hongkongensis]
MRTLHQPTSTQYHVNYLIEHCIFAVAFFLPLSLDVTSVFLSAGCLLWFGKMAVTRRMDFKRTPFDGAVLALVVLSAASVLGSPDRGFSFYNYYHLMGRYIIVYYLVINNVHSLEQVKRLVYSLLASALLVAAYGFYQYIHGMDISAFEWVDGEQFPDLKVRIFSTLKNPNLLAGFLVVIMALAAGLGLCSEKLLYKCGMLGFVLILGCCLVLTYSRGAWLSVLAVCAAYGVLYNRKIFWVLLAVPLVIIYGYDGVMERLVSILNPTDTSSTLRLALWESTLAMIMDKPILGIGWGAYWLVYPEYDFFVQNTATTIFHAHNMYLHIAAEIGLPGLAAFLIIMYGHARLALSVVTETANRWINGLMLGAVSALLGLAVSGFTDYVMYNIQMSMLYWLLCALVVTVWQAKYRY